MEKVFNKLVRDNIPNIIKSHGEEYVVRVLEEDEYEVELYKKLLEEVNEVINAEDSIATLEELADVLEVLKSIAELNDRNLADVIELSDQKRLKRGGFEKRLFLEKTYFSRD